MQLGPATNAAAHRNADGIPLGEQKSCTMTEVAKYREKLLPSFDASNPKNTMKEGYDLPATWDERVSPLIAWLDELDVIISNLIDGSAGRGADTKSAMLNFIVEMPRRLGEAIPEAKGKQGHGDRQAAKSWLTDDMLYTSIELRRRDNVEVPCIGKVPHPDSGIFFMLRVMIRRIRRQIIEIHGDGKYNWDDVEGTDPTADGISVTEFAKRSTVHSLRTFLEMHPYDAGESIIAIWLYTMGLHKLRLREYSPELFKKCEEHGNKAPYANSNWQIYTIWNKALREHCDPDSWRPPWDPADQEEVNARVVKIFDHATWRLDAATRAMALPFVGHRGISIRVAQYYVTGTAIAWCQFTSASLSRVAALDFAGDAGTYFQVAIHAAPVIIASPYPEEFEVLTSTLTMMEIGSKLGDTHAAILGFPHDICTCAQIPEESSLQRRDPADVVRHRCAAMRQSAGISENFMQTWIEPRVSEEPGAVQASQQKRLINQFRVFLESESQHVLLILAKGGSGKSAAGV